MTVTLANSGKKENRRELDFYPTPPDVTHALIDFLQLPSGTIWEPACGDGSMAVALRQRGHTVIATDLRETGYGEGGVDFLTADRRACDAIVTNPPFFISEEFIRRSLGFAPIVAMVLKSQYWHAKKRQDLFAEHPPAWVLPLTWRPDFLFDQREIGDRKGAPTMECIWTVWIAGETDAKYRPLSRPLPRVAAAPKPETGSALQSELFS